MEYIGEFLGTCLLVLLGNGVVSAVVLKETKSSGEGWLMIVFGWGLAVTIALYAVSGMSPGHLNPAVSLTFATLGQITWGTALAYSVMQVLGAMVGQLLVYGFYRPQFKLMMEESGAFDCFSTSPAIYSTLDNLFSEAMATFVFVLAILCLPSGSQIGHIAPVLVGLIVMTVGFSLGSTTGFAINPARDLGPRLVYHLMPVAKWQSSWSYAWVPVVGPIIGAVLAGQLFTLLSGMMQ